MADTGRFKMAWEDNEDEYEDFYNFDAAPMEDAEAGELKLPSLCLSLVIKLRPSEHAPSQRGRVRFCVWLKCLLSQLSSHGLQGSAVSLGSRAEAGQRQYRRRDWRF